MNIVYKITFIPHLGTDKPKYYIGSKFNYKPGYFGSVSSNRLFDYTNGLPLRKWWKNEVKNTPSNFTIEILEDCSFMNKHELVICELKWQQYFNIKTPDFFNQAYASGKFVSGPKDTNVKLKLSKSLKKYYTTEEGKLKRERLTGRNKETRSAIMKERWQHPTEKMVSRVTTGRPKGSQDLKKRNTTFRSLTDGTRVFINANDAAAVYKITPTNIRRRCRINYKGVWRYIDDTSCADN